MWIAYLAMLAKSAKCGYRRAMFQFFTKKTETLHFSLPSLINMCIVAWQNDFFRKKLNMSSLLHFMKQIFFNLKEWGRRRVQTKVTCFFVNKDQNIFF